MATTFHFYERTFSEVDNSLSTYIADVSSDIISAITPTATILLGIYVALWGWSMMRGVISEPVTDGLTRIVRLAVITGIALNVGRYNDYLADWLWNSPEAMASYVASGQSNSATNVQYLDTLMSQVYAFGDSYWQKANATTLPDLGMVAMALLVWGAGIFSTGYAAFLLILAKMALAIILAIGPIFVLMMIFEPAKRFFEAWFGQALNYVFLVVLTAGAIKLIITILQTYMNDVVGQGLNSNPGIGQALPVIVLSFIAGLTMVQLPSISSALGGGVSLGTMGAVGWTLRKAMGSAGAARNLVTGKTLSDMRSNRRQKVMNARWAERNPGITSRAVSGAASGSRAIYNKITRSRNN